MKIKTVAVLGAGAVGSYVIWGLSRRKDIRLGVLAEGKRAEKLISDEIGFNTGAVSHLMMQLPILFSSHTTDMAGDVPEHDGSTNKTVSQLNRFLYIVSLS